MRKIVVVGAAAILSLGVGGTALAASNGLDDNSGISVRPVSTSSPSHDAGDDHGGDRARGVNDDATRDANDANDANDADDANDDHGGDQATGATGATGANDDGAGHDAGDDHGRH